MKIAFLTVLFGVTTLAGLAACARKPIFPDQASIPAAPVSPLDGTWRLMSGKANSIFRIDKGRMYYVDKRKPSKAHLVYARQMDKASRTRSAADLNIRPGGVMVRGIRETGDPMTYTCQSASYGGRTNTLGFGRGEIRIASATEIVLRTFPNPQTELNETIEDRYWRENLDNQAWFEKTARTAQGRDLRPGKETTGKTGDIGPSPIEPVRDAVQVRKVLIVPLERMEANGKLSKHARAFIREAVQNASSARGSVEIKYPSNAPDPVVEALLELGVRAVLDDHRDDYELVIIERDTR